jgi:excisionase family DNA binding protein
MMIGTVEAAQRLGISQARVGELIRAKRLPAQKIGRCWVIDENDLKMVEDRITGFPKGKKRK